jgi:hypothetical protein
MEPLYRHTQVGWVIIGSLGAGIALLGLWLPAVGPGTGAWLVGLVLVVALVLFGTLTVEVDPERIRVWFGPGVIRKTIRLADVSAWQAVRNPWYVGWGIRMGPSGMVWNVSGLDAVELALSEKRFRIGTDQPEALVEAITRARGVSSAVSAAADARPLEPRGGAAGAGWALAIVLGLGLLGGMFWLQMRPPEVAVTPRGLEIQSLFYSTTVPAADVVSVSLEPRLPRVLVRTGFVLRGHFRLEGLGDGRLFVDAGHPPYLVRRQRGFVIVNLTRALHDALAGAWPDRAGAPGEEAGEGYSR